MTFKRGVYTNALRHLAPFARQVAGPQAVPHRTLPDPRAQRTRVRQRPRGWGGKGDGQVDSGQGGGPGQN